MQIPLHNDHPIMRIRASRSAGRKARTRVRLAFTLIELVVVLTIMLLAAVVAVPSFLRFQHSWQLQWAARRTLALAGEARGLAVSRDTSVDLAYDPVAHGLRLSVPPGDPPPPDDTASGKPAPDEPPVSERLTPDTRLLEYPLDVNVHLERPDGTRADSLRFFGDGRAEPVTVRLEREGFPPLVFRMNGRTGRLVEVEAVP